jgi:hypothetical protein
MIAPQPIAQAPQYIMPPELVQQQVQGAPKTPIPHPPQVYGRETGYTSPPSLRNFPP